MREHNLVAIALIVGAFVLLAATSMIAAQGSKIVFLIYLLTAASLVCSISQGAKGVTKSEGTRFNYQAQLGMLGIVGTVVMVALTVPKV